MKRFLVSAFLFASWYLAAEMGNNQLPNIDFDDSMKTALFPHKVKDNWGSYAINFFRTLYEHNNPSSLKPSEEPIIERIVHQILAW